MNPSGPDRADARRILLVFAKAPEPGRVKTRLAAKLGDEEAARIYDALATRAVDALRGGAYRMVVYFDPPHARERVRAWLGGDDLELLPQPSGTLGDRLAHAFEWGLSRADAACVVGTDIPDLSRTVVESAFAALEAPDGVDAYFGPAEDGGYYLLALRSPIASLFEDIPWSTGDVLEVSLERAARNGLRVGQGPRLRDVDHASDVPDHLLRNRGISEASCRTGPNEPAANTLRPPSDAEP